MGAIEKETFVPFCKFANFFDALWWTEPGVDTKKKFGRNPEPAGIHFLGSGSEPGTHWNPLSRVRLGIRNPLEPIIYLMSGVSPGTHNFRHPDHFVVQFVVL